MNTNRTKEITRRLDEIVESPLVRNESGWSRKENWGKPFNSSFRNIIEWTLDSGKRDGTGLSFTDFGKSITTQGVAVGTKEADSYKKIPNSEVIQDIEGWLPIFDVKLSGRYQIVGDRNITENYGEPIDALFDDLDEAIAYYERVFERVPKRKEE